MRICVITNGYPLTAEDYPGIFNRHFAHELKRQGHDVFVFAPNRKGAKETEPEVPVHWFPWLGGDEALADLNVVHPRDLVKTMSLLWQGSVQITQFVQSHKIDTCMAMWAIPSGWYAYVARRRLGIPYAVWSLGSDIWTWARYPLVRNLIGKILSTAILRFADGKRLSAEVERIAHLPCEFLPTTRILPPPGQVPARVDRTKTNLLFVGRLERVKGVDILLQAAQRLIRDGANMHLHIWGVGSLAAALDADIRDKGLGAHVFLHGYAPPAAVSDWLTACDCLVIPSRMESIPVVLSDAMQMGKPVIVSDVGDMGDLVRQNCVGRVVPPEDPEALKQSILDFMNDDRRIYTAGIDCLKHEFDLSQIAARYLSRLERVTNGLSNPL